MLKDIGHDEDVEVILRFIEHEYDWSGKSIAIFSCAPEGYFRNFPLAIPVQSRLRISDHPHVKPLANLLDSYGGYGVVLVDKQGARLFSFHLGELREQEGVVGESIRKNKTGGGSQVRGRRGSGPGQVDHIDEVAERNMREVIDFATTFFSENHVRRILIGGTDENIALFRGQLPKSWQSLVIGSFPMSMTASHPEVLEKAMEKGREVEMKLDANLAETIVTAAAKGKGGVIDLEDTLKAIHKGRVLTLLVRKGFHVPGSRCSSCDFVSSLPMDTCPYCGGKPIEVPDVAELAVRRTIFRGGEVEFFDSNQEIKGFQQIGALLRF
jgi:peptide subunit release factor 1 (eRF1)